MSHDLKKSQELQALDEVKIAVNVDGDSNIPVDAMTEAKNPEVDGPIKAWLRKIFMGVELRGIERVMPEDRQPKGVINNLLMWWSVNCVLTTVPIGTLGPAVFGMGLRDTILTIVGFTILG
ncbi:hypothetical protein CPB97_005369, partial [Podila verticillata]